MRVTFHGGPVLSSLDAVSVFLGRAYVTSTIWDWANDPLLAEQACRVNDALRDVLDSAYLDGLSEYTPAGRPSIGRGRLAATATLPFASPDTQYGMALDQAIPDSDIRDALRLGFANGALEAPAADSGFVIFLPPNVAFVHRGEFSSALSLLGYHDSFELEGVLVPYAVVTHPGFNPTIPVGAPDTFDQLTFAASHELIEMILDPTTTPGWGLYDDNNGQEVVDVCPENNLPVWDRFHGYLLSLWWSETKQSCQMAAEDGLAKPARQATVAFLDGGDCQLPPVVGIVAEFSVRLTPQPHPPLVYEWTCAGAATVGPVDQATCHVQLPADSTPVTIGCTVDDFQGCRVTSQTTIVPQPAARVAFLEHLCKLRLMVHRNFLVDPLWDPLRDLTTLPVTGDDVDRIHEITKQLSQHVNQLRQLHKDIRP